VSSGVEEVGEFDRAARREAQDVVEHKAMRLSADRRRPYRARLVGPIPDDLVAASELCSAVLGQLAARDWSVPAAATDWTCRTTLEHLCSLAYAHQLASRAREFRSVAVRVVSNAPIEDLIWTMHVQMLVLADVARAAPDDARAFHPAGMADASGWVAMGIDELLIHTNDIAAGLDTRFEGPSLLARAVLDRLFPWWPVDADPWAALCWANGRLSLPSHPNPGASWLWHCAPLDEWDGTIPQWDPVANRPGASVPKTV
jgi:hypothetical protein